MIYFAAKVFPALLSYLQPWDYFKINIIINPQVEAGMTKASLLVNGTTIATIEIEQVDGNISDKTNTNDLDDHAFVEEAKKDK